MLFHLDYVRKTHKVEDLHDMLVDVDELHLRAARIQELLHRQEHTQTSG